MKLYALDIPEQPADLAVWLEKHLLGWNLGELVAELSAAAEPRSDPSPALATVLGPYSREVLTRGLTSLPAPALRTLLRWPALLLDLQRWLLEENPPYWTAQFQAAPEHHEAFQRTRDRLQDWLAADRLDEASPPPSSRRRRYWVGFAVAAALLLALAGLWHWSRPGPTAEWGWNRSDVYAANQPAPRYLDRLADAAGQWFDQPPGQASELAERLRSMRRGCDRVQQEDHAPLKVADRVWLRERCRAWTAKFDQHLAALEKGGDPGAIRAEADATVRKLVEALHSRARQVEQALLIPREWRQQAMREIQLRDARST